MDPLNQNTTDINTVFAKRRQTLLAQLPVNSAVIVLSPSEVRRNGDTDYRYRPNSDFYYLTGFCEPEAVAVLIKQEKGEGYILFVPPADPSQEIWTGKRAGVEGACKLFHADEAYSVDAFSQVLPHLLIGCETIVYSIGHSGEIDHLIQKLFTQQRFAKKQTHAWIKQIVNLDLYLYEMRLHKSPEEINLMRRAAEITARAHQRAMQICQPDLMEYQLAAEITHTFYQQGAFAEAYPSIVGSGHNGCILHYHENNARLKNGDLVLIDAGAEYQYYAADVTRTFPVNGKFSKHQKAIYEIVLAAQLAAIDKAKPGNTFDDLQTIATQTIVQGLIDLKILKGSVTELIEQKAHQAFYMHGIGHWLGLDVHDVGVYFKDGKRRPFAAGMVITIEPGIYIAPDNIDVDTRWRGIGIRIEDDILITEESHEILTAAIPKKVADIEKIMQARG